MLPFKSNDYDSPEPGTRLIVLGAVHGNEICGTRAIERVNSDLDAGTQNMMRGRLTMVPAPSADALAAAWRAHFPANIRAGSPDILESLQAAPTSAPGMPAPAGIPATDSAFRAEVTRLYTQMKQALAAGDLQAFAIAYDSLGAIVGR